jgi:hypothetical protein
MNYSEETLILDADTLMAVFGALVSFIEVLVTRMQKLYCGMSVISV